MSDHRPIGFFTWLFKHWFADGDNIKILVGLLVFGPLVPAVAASIYQQSGDPFVLWIMYLFGMIVLAIMLFIVALTISYVIEFFTAWRDFKAEEKERTMRILRK